MTHTCVPFDAPTHLHVGTDFVHMLQVIHFNDRRNYIQIAFNEDVNSWSTIDTYL